VSQAWPPLSAARLRLSRQLQHARGRAANRQFLAEGPQCVREALAFGDVRLVITGPHPTAESVVLAQAADRQGLAVAAASEEEWAAITDTTHGQGVVAVCGLPALTLDDVVAPRLVLVLDEVRDPGNVGTLIRTADAFGAAAVLASAGTAEVWAPKCVRASVGSVFHLPLVTGLDLADVVAWANRHDLTTLGADTSGRRLDDVRPALERPTAWVVGNEAQGLPPDHLSLLDEAVTVPMWGRAESLNVASAAAICLYETALAQNCAP